MSNLKSIPANLQTDFLRDTESDVMPEVRREGNILIYPAFIRADVRDNEDGTRKTVFRYFSVQVPYTGQPVDDYEECGFRCYAELRKFFYGDWAVQNEQILKGIFAQHQYAVKQAFPKAPGETFANVAGFEKVKGDFWSIIDVAAGATNKTREDFPTGTSADLLAFCVAAGMSSDQIADFAIKILGITADLTRFGRNWEELFHA